MAQLSELCPLKSMPCLTNQPSFWRDSTHAVTHSPQCVRDGGMTIARALCLPYSVQFERPAFLGLGLEVPKFDVSRIGRHSARVVQKIVEEFPFGKLSASLPAGGEEWADLSQWIFANEYVGIFLPGILHAQLRA